MKNNCLLAASLICADPLNMEGDIAQLNEANIDFIHFDVMDGSFVSRYGLYPEILSAVKKKYPIPVDVHMMVNNPEDYITTFQLAGADYFNFHVEATHQISRVIKKIKESGMKPGVALNPATSVHCLEWIMQDIEMVVVMAINPGVVAHPFIPSMLKKITAIREMANQMGNTKLLIEVDGGVTPVTAPDMISAGANVLVCGTGTIFRPQEDTIINKTISLRKVLSENVV
jgi:ribulose-phosphate 3-epimerase